MITILKTWTPPPILLNKAAAWNSIIHLHKLWNEATPLFNIVLRGETATAIKYCRLISVKWEITNLKISSVPY